jgi:hypothetical protein
MSAGNLLRRIQRGSRGLAIVAIVVSSGSACRAQITEAKTASIIDAEAPAERPTAVTYGPQTVTRYRFGAKATARGGTVQNIMSMVAVPLTCAEQEVELIEEDLSPHVAGVAYRDTDEGVRQMLISIPTLSPRQEAHAYAIFEVRTRTIIAPKETATLVAPKKPEKERALKRYVGVSPYINTNDRKIRAAVKEALAAAKPTPAGGTGDWQRVEALYDYALDHVKYKEGDDKPAVQTLAQGEGDCQAIGAVFVAMCRTEKIPARMVWVNDHQYAEFYLEDAEGNGCWYPVETAGSRAFGEMPLARVILQKGDNFRVPERRGERLRYASDYSTLLSAPTRQPRIGYVRELVQ